MAAALMGGLLALLPADAAGWRRGNFTVVDVSPTFELSVSVGGRPWLAGAPVAIQCGGARYSSDGGDGGSRLHLLRAGPASGTDPALGSYDGFAADWRAGSCTQLRCAGDFAHFGG